MGDEKTGQTLRTGWESACTTELERLSSDPALAKHPHPELHPKFRDPDELHEEEPVSNPVISMIPRIPLCRTGGELRRSPKE